MRHAILLAAAACGGSKAPPAEPPPPPPRTAIAQPVDDHAKRAEIVSAHRKLEDEQQEALAATCDPPNAGAQPRCLPSCYTAEPPDPRAHKKLKGQVEIQHVACEAPGDPAQLVLADEIDGAKLAVRTVRGRFPAAHKAGTWQATVETALAAAPALPKGDVVRVTGAWRAVVHPQTKEKLRCVAVSQFTRSLPRGLDACGSNGALGCEAIGDAAAHGIDVVHYRLAEARALQAAGNAEACQQAALEAVAVARGMPRWRQYAQLNVAKWVAHPGYRTRFDGTLDEDALFVRAASLGASAEEVYGTCGGTAPHTTAAQEQSFHTCW